MVTNRHRVNLVEIPSKITPVSANRSDTYRYLINHAFKKGLAPITTELPAFSSGVMLIYPTELAKIEQVAETYKLSLAVAFAGLCAASVISLAEESTLRISGEKKFLKSDWVGSLKHPRPDQKKYYEGITLGLLANKIVMAEASTGLGKGRAMMAAAVDMIEQKKCPVVVAAPTLSVMSQLYNEFEKLELPDIKVAIKPGKHEFVDNIKLAQYIEQINILNKDDPSDMVTTATEAISKWIIEGGRNTSENELSKAMLSMGITPAWLMDDLINISGDFPAQDFKLTSESDSSCASAVVLKNYNEKISLDAGIIICSHTMLCLAAKTTRKNEQNEREWAILPLPSVLFIDEAHQFEHAMAQVNAEQLSFFSLRLRLLKFKREQNLKSGSIVSKALKTLSSLTYACRILDGQDSQSVVLNEPRNEAEAKSFESIISLLATLKLWLSSKSVDLVQEIKGDRDALKLIAKNTLTPNVKITLSFSPTRNYPSISVGPSNMKPLLTGLWNKIEGGVVLASATLYTPDPDGTPKCDYVRDILGVPLHRIYAPKPVESKHVYSIPILHYPKKDKLQSLAAPSAKLRKTEDEVVWLKNVAKEIFEHPSKSATGGTLVLCTAYTQLSGIVDELISLGVDKNRIVAQERGKKFDFSKTEFVEKHQSGLRPILLGLGIAWTGIDMTDKTIPEPHPELDMLLTDLVIVRAPIGLNRTNSMASRIERNGTYPIEKEALLLLKQGLGRLIRKDGVIDRHIWIMDGRLWLDWKGMENFTASARKLFAKYKKSCVF